MLAVYPAGQLRSRQMGSRHSSILLAQAVTDQIWPSPAWQDLDAGVKRLAAILPGAVFPLSSHCQGHVAACQPTVVTTDRSAPVASLTCCGCSPKLSSCHRSARSMVPAQSQTDAAALHVQHASCSSATLAQHIQHVAGPQIIVNIMHLVDPAGGPKTDNCQSDTLPEKHRWHLQLQLLPALEPQQCLTAV